MKLLINESYLSIHVTQEDLKSIRNNCSSVNKNDRFFSCYDMTPEDRYWLAFQFNIDTANKDNFFINSVGFWTPCKKPRKAVDYDSSKLLPDMNLSKGSKYWYTSEGVYRYSNHWGSDVSSCSWYIKDRRYRNYGVSKGNWETAFIKWKDLRALGSIIVLTKEEIEKSTLLSKLFTNVKLDEYNYRPVGFTFSKDVDCTNYIRLI